jgi:serine/threonine protein kinase
MAPEVMQAGESIDQMALNPDGAATAAAAKVSAAPTSARPGDTKGECKDDVVSSPRDGKSQHRALGEKKVSNRALLHKHRGKGGRKGYGKRADIWSVGITLCEMATGRAPFANAAAAIYAVCVSKKFPTFPEEFTADAHAFLSRWVNI